VTGEALCRAVILGRTGTACEGCRSQAWTDKAHRVARSAGGRWVPGNVLGLCGACHMWAHAHPGFAGVAGWVVPGWIDPVTVAVYLSSAMLTPGWYWLDVDGAPHGYGADDVPSVAAPALPPHYPRELLPPARITVAP
jgi:hypothetical protein